MSEFPDSQDKWRRASYALASAGHHLSTQVQFDGRIDILLRCWEKEFKDGFSTSNEIDFSMGHYSSLSRYWVFSMYETVRAYVERIKTKELTDDLTAKNLRDHFAKVRMPLAKFEISGTNKKSAPEISLITNPPGIGEQPKKYERGDTSYYPVTEFDLSTGSIVWKVVVSNPPSQEQISRLSLSEKFLEIFSQRVPNVSGI